MQEQAPRKRLPNERQVLHEDPPTKSSSVQALLILPLHQLQPPPTNPVDCLPTSLPAALSHRIDLSYKVGMVSFLPGTRNAFADWITGARG